MVESCGSGRQSRHRIGPFGAPIDGLLAGEYLTNESVFSLTELPPRLVVIGGGPLGCELAQEFRRLGSEVHLVSTTENLMPGDAPEAGELIRRRFEHEELRLHLGFKAVRAGGGRLTVQGPAGACGDRLEDCNCLAVHQAARHITQVIRAA